MTPVNIVVIASLSLYYMFVCYFFSKDCSEPENPNNYIEEKY